MRNFVKFFGLAVLGVVCLGSVSFGKKIEMPKHELKFEVAEDEPLAIGRNEIKRMGGFCPEYKVVLEFKTPTNLDSKQIQYADSQLNRRARYSNSIDDNNIERYVTKNRRSNFVSIYSKSVDDVKAVVESIVKSINEQVFDHLQNFSEKVEGYKVSITETENEIAQLEQEKEKFAKSFGCVKRRVLYSKIEEAEGDIPNFIKQFSLSNIEIAGIEAKLREVRGKENSYRKIENIHPHIVAIRVEQEAELEGAKARRNAAREGYDLAMKFIDISRREIVMNDSLRELSDRVRKLKESFESGEKALENLPTDWQFVVLESDVVKIYPVVCEK